MRRVCNHRSLIFWKFFENFWENFLKFLFQILLLFVQHQNFHTKWQFCLQQVLFGKFFEVFWAEFFVIICDHPYLPSNSSTFCSKFFCWRLKHWKSSGNWRAPTHYHCLDQKLSTSGGDRRVSVLFFNNFFLFLGYHWRCQGPSTVNSIGYWPMAVVLEDIWNFFKNFQEERTRVFLWVQMGPGLPCCVRIRSKIDTDGGHKDVVGTILSVPEDFSFFISQNSKNFKQFDFFLFFCTTDSTHIILWFELGFVSQKFINLHTQSLYLHL